MSLTGTARPDIDPLRNYPRLGDQTNTAPGYYRRHDDPTPAGGPGITPARQIVLDFLHARLEANNARIAFILDPTPANMTAWADAENLALGDDE